MTKQVIALIAQHEQSVPHQLNDEPGSRKHAGQSGRQQPRPAGSEAPIERNNAGEKSRQHRSRGPALLEIHDRTEPCDEEPEDELRNTERQSRQEGRLGTNETPDPQMPENPCQQW